MLCISHRLFPTPAKSSLKRLAARVWAYFILLVCADTFSAFPLRSLRVDWCAQCWNATGLSSDHNHITRHFWTLLHYDAFEVTMSTLKRVILQDKGQDIERKLDWSYIEWDENEVVTTGVANAETQTDGGPFEHKETQTSNPVIMHINVKRTNSMLRHSSLVDADSLVAPLFQFDRQAPGRISTSPTLRRMRSTRHSLIYPQDAVRIGSTQEEPSSASAASPESPLSPVHRVKSPLAASPLSDGETCHNHEPTSSTGQQRTRSHRSKTSDQGIISTGHGCQSSHPAPIKGSGNPDGEVKVSFYLLVKGLFEVGHVGKTKSTRNH